MSTLLTAVRSTLCLPCIFSHCLSSAGRQNAKGVDQILLRGLVTLSFFYLSVLKRTSEMDLIIKHIINALLSSDKTPVSLKRFIANRVYIHDNK